MSEIRTLVENRLVELQDLIENARYDLAQRQGEVDVAIFNLSTVKKRLDDYLTRFEVLQKELDKFES